ncbi:MAG: hypothetical protein ACRCSN_01515 [Dermatophilaceae bacterium]
MNTDDLNAAIQSSGTALAVVATDTVVLYDRATGGVAHVHHSITMEGADRRTTAQRRDAARAAAASAGASVEDLDVLDIDDFAPEPGRGYRVDLVTRRLVPQQAPDPPTSEASRHR